MSRLHLTFNCEGSTLAATLDTAPLTTGLLLVSGGARWLQLPCCATSRGAFVHPAERRTKPLP